MPTAGSQLLCPGVEATHPSRKSKDAARVGHPSGYIISEDAIAAVIGPRLVVRASSLRMIAVAGR